MVTSVMLTAEEASEIAARRGLGLEDAVALRLLADDVEQAERIAAMFDHPNARPAAA